jgi:site-specific DNA-methyltransferase (adenine-specific)
MENQILHGDCVELLKTIPDNSVDLVVTSPPYNKGYWSMNRNENNGFKTKTRKITYSNFDDDLDPDVYENQQRGLLTELCRVIKPTGSIFYNHLDILHKHTTIHPKYVYDFPLKQIIIWNRKNTPKLDKSYFFPINEYIFWIKKDIGAIPKFNRKKSLFNKNIWDINPARDNNFPAPFPEVLVTNCILSTTDENDVVLDCYGGSGTTAIASINTNRKFIIMEREDVYYDSIKKRIENKILEKQRGLF